MFSIKQVPRSENKKADALSKITFTSFSHLSKQVLVEEFKENSINEVELLAAVEEEGDTWMTPIYEHLTKGTLPTEVNKARAVDSNTRSVAAKALRTGYYWPTMHKDARALIRAYQDCQGIDIAGPFPEGPGKVKLLIVAIDYFTKFGLPREIISDNGKQFQDNPLKDCNGDTPFSLTYGTKAVIRTEIGMPTLKTAEVDIVQNDEALEINLDLLEERIEKAAIYEAKSKAKIEKYYNSKVRSISFKLGHLKWKGPYEVTEALGKGAYKLRDRSGKQFSRTWNVRNLKKCYVYEM
ncbi:reverse transcriptase domain-containing protein [Tanacetum coccineum]